MSPVQVLLAGLACAGLAGLAFAGCGNPAIDDRIEALGGENPNVEPSEFHRPGQPCVLCHGEYEGAEPKIAVGGTVFVDQIGLTPVEGADVVLTDTRGISVTVKTNCVGNFFVPSGEWNDKYPDPQFPLAAEIRCPTYDDAGQLVLDELGAPVIRVKAMASVISRDGSCATCHTMAPQGAQSTGRIFCNAQGETTPYPPISADCKGEIK